MTGVSSLTNACEGEFCKLWVLTDAENSQTDELLHIPANTSEVRGCYRLGWGWERG